MSARLNFNEIPMVQWKGKTFNQITSSIQNNKVTSITSNRLLFKPLPLKIYRREIVTNIDNCKSRKSVTIDEINRPNGSINNSGASSGNYGEINTLDNLLPNNSSDYTNTSTTCTTQSAAIFSPEMNAKRRVRSSGMVKRQFDISKNNDSYYTSTNQYLVGRNRTFQQNQYNFIRQGDSTAKPGSALASSNVYSPNGLNHCQKYQMGATSFSYIWVDGITYSVTIPGGYYSVEDINATFKQTMVKNFHYFILTPNTSSDFVGTQLVTLDTYVGIQNIGFLMNIGFNNNTNNIELQVMEMDSVRFNNSMVTVPSSSTWINFYNSTAKSPRFVIADSIFGTAIGFSAGTYPTTSSTVDITFVSSFTPKIQPLYVKLYYKPNNPQFAQQGAVSASSLITRKKYDSITNSSALYRRTYGSSVANALAYGVSEAGYTIKDKMGYPNKKTPFFPKYSNDMRVCSLKKISNSI
jgi:hypothetical protein